LAFTKPAMSASILHITQSLHSPSIVITARRILMMVAMACAASGSPMHAADESLSLTLSSGLASDHVDRGIERAGTSWQSSLYGSVSGWKGRVWYGRPLDAGGVEEVRSSLGHDWKLGKATAIEVTGTHFWYVDQPVSGAPAHSFEGAVRFSSIAPERWNPAIEIAYDIRYHATAVELSVERERLTGVGAWLLRAYGGQVSARDVLPDAIGAPLRDSYTYYGASIGLRRRVSPHWSVQGVAGLAGSSSQNSAWSDLPPQTARGRFALNALYDF